MPQCSGVEDLEHVSFHFRQGCRSECELSAEERLPRLDGVCTELGEVIVEAPVRLRIVVSPRDELLEGARQSHVLFKPELGRPPPDRVRPSVFCADPKWAMGAQCTVVELEWHPWGPLSYVGDVLPRRARRASLLPRPT